MKLNDEHPYLLVTLLAAMVMLGPFSMEAVVPGLPSSASFFNVSSSEIQLTLTAWLLGSAFGQLFWGPISDRIGRRKSMLIALSVFIVSSTGCFLATDFWLLILCRLGQGLSAGGGSVTAKAMVRDLFDGERAVQIFGYLTSAVFLGPMIAPVLGGLFIKFSAWKSVYAFLATWAALCLTVVFLALNESLRPEKRSKGSNTPWSSLGPLFRQKAYRINLLIIAITAAGMFSFVTGSAELFIEEKGLSATQFGFVFLLVAAGFVVGVKFNNTLASWKASDRYYLGGWSCLTGGVLLLAAEKFPSQGLTGLALIIVPCSVFYFGLGVIQPLAMGRALQPFSQLAGSASAWLGFTMMGSGAVSSAVIGRLHSKTEIAIAIAFILSGFASLLLARALPINVLKEESSERPSSST